ncbi:MAG: S8 family serine peptidase, partial [Chloroflexota bacterium]|nr:S8 family serine peptidase [Chloroflexota bacterium]
ARLWAVKVFDNWGNGRLSWYVCGVDWIAAQRDPRDPTRPLIEVANMSLRTDRSWDDQNCGYTNNDPLHRAICRAVARGTTIVAAAGNQRTWASTGVPAAYDEVITVSALADFNGRAGGGAPSTCSSWGSRDVDDTHADFSNFGWDVDIKASGKCILSTYPGSRYRISSGTSMATPAVAGAVALWHSRHPGSSPAAVKAVLQAAGRLDWALWTDPDPYHERMLDVSSFGRGPDFSLVFSTGPRVVGPAGGTVGYTVQFTRGDAFNGSIYLTASGLPRGASARFSTNPSSGLRGFASILTVTVPPNTAQGTYDLTVTGTAGTLRRSARTRLIVDRTPPTVQPPGVRLTGPVIGYYYLPTLLSWSGADAVAGTSSFELQRSVNGGTFATIGRFAAATRQIGHWLSPGQSYRFRVRATDRVGNVSGWATGPSFRLDAPEETNWAIAYGGAWRREVLADARGAAVKYATAAGAWARFTFTGRQVSWAAHRGPTRGSARVYVNGVYLTTVGLWASTAGPRRVVFARVWPDSAQRTVEVRVVGTAGRPRVDIDAFVVLR